MGRLRRSDTSRSRIIKTLQNETRRIRNTSLHPTRCHDEPTREIAGSGWVSGGKRQVPASLAFTLILSSACPACSQLKLPKYTEQQKRQMYFKMPNARGFVQYDRKYLEEERLTEQQATHLSGLEANKSELSIKAKMSVKGPAVRCSCKRRSTVKVPLDDYGHRADYLPSEQRSTATTQHLSTGLLTRSYGAARTAFSVFRHKRRQ